MSAAQAASRMGRATRDVLTEAFHIIATQEQNHIISMGTSGNFASYTQFRTKENAKLAWAFTFHPQSGPAPPTFPRGSEHSSWLYRTPYGGYTFGNPTPDRYRGYDFVRPPRGEPKSGYTRVGWIHTHPVHSFDDTGRGTGSDFHETFSVADGRLANSSRGPVYVVTPRGQLLRLDYPWVESANPFNPGRVPDSRRRVHFSDVNRVIPNIFQFRG